MSREKFDANEWGRQLDDGAATDAEMRLGRRLRQHRPDVPPMPKPRKLALRRQLLDTYEQGFGWRRVQSWAGNAAALALLLAIVIVAWGWLGSTEGGAGLTAPTATADRAAGVASDPTATPVADREANPDFPAPTANAVTEMAAPPLPATATSLAYTFYDAAGAPVVALAGYEWMEGVDTVTITLYWQIVAPEMTPATHVRFLQLVDGDNGDRPVTRDTPLAAEAPAQAWAPGELLVDPITLEKSTIPDGFYDVNVGLYSASTNQRLAVEPAAAESGAVTLPEMLPLVRLPAMIDGAPAVAGRAWIVTSEPAGGQPLAPGVPITLTIAYELTGVETAELSARLRWTDQESGFAPGSPFITTVSGPNGTVTADLMVPAGEARVAVDLTVALFLVTYDDAGEPISPLLFSEMMALAPPWQFLYDFGPAEE